MQYQVVVLGGGPGGYVAAIRAAQRGAKVALIEKDQLGGTCLNRGCIPTKALIRSAEVFENIRHAAEYGIKAGSPEVDAQAVFARKDRIVKRLVQGVNGLIRANMIDLYNGSGRVMDPHTVDVTLPDGKKQTVRTEKLIIATGSKAAVPPIPGADKPGVMTSDLALSLGFIPKEFVIIGGGVIGLEFAYLMSAFGAKVTIIEMLPRILPNADKETIDELVSSLQGNGVKIITNARVERIEGVAPRLTVIYQKNGEKIAVPVENVLIATGRVPNLEGTEALGLGDKKGIAVNEKMETKIPGVYAIGDVTGGIQLAHVASAQGLVAAENATGGTARYDGNTVPSCLYTLPEVAWVGLSEEAAKEKYGEIKVSKFPFLASGKALAYGETKGFAKIVADPKYGEIYGLHIVGPHATDLISEGVLAKTLEATVEELAKTIHPHPTLSEAIMEAAHSVLGEGIHWK